MTTVEALKRIYVALGGDESEFTAQTNPEAVDQVAAALEAHLADQGE